MEDLFTGLSRAVQGTPAVALSAALAWGVLSIVLSPCHLASLPLIVGFVGGQGPTTTRRALLISGLFAAGILVTIAAIGVLSALAGRMWGDVGAWGNYAMAGIFFLVGLNLMDVIPTPWTGPTAPGMKRRGPLAALILGLVFGIALGPCTFAYMIPVITIAVGLARTRPVYGLALLLAYGIGHCLVIVLAGTSTQQVQRYLRWNEKSQGAVTMKRVCGALVLVGGLYLLYTAA